MGFSQSVWLIFEVFLFIAYLMVLFHVIGDLFRDDSLSGWVRAVWILFLVLVPLITALIYLIVRGRGMALRRMEAAGHSQAATDEYIRRVAGSSGAEQIARARSLLESGSITQAEYEKLKSNALRGGR